jgi:hypothetical protein
MNAMKRWVWCLGLLTAALLLLGMQDRERARELCEDACKERAAACFEYCGSHDDPIECESECDEARDDCFRECHR